MFHVSGSLSSVSSACTSCGHLRRGVTPASRASHASFVLCSCHFRFKAWFVGCTARRADHGTHVHLHRKYKQLFFLFWGVNFLMQLQFLAPVELFFKQLKGYSF